MSETRLGPVPRVGRLHMAPRLAPTPPNPSSMNKKRRTEWAAFVCKCAATFYSISQKDTLLVS